jgi:hypothetical protein
MINRSFSSWDSFKLAMVGLDVVNTLQYEELDSNRYLLEFFDSDAFRGFMVLFFTDTTAKADFDTNYKASANLPLSKNVSNLVSQTFGTSPLKPKWQMWKYSLIHSQSTFIDLEITTQIKVVHGGYIIESADNIHTDDILEMSMIDKNDVLGYFGLYGLTVGQDILELWKFSHNWHPNLMSGTKVEENFQGVFGAFTVYPGLFMRYVFESNGGVSMVIRPTMNWYQ